MKVNASILHLRVSSSVANDVVRGDSWPGLCLVLRALQTTGKLFGSACSCDLLFLRAADGEWADLRFHRVYSRASHPAFRIPRNGDEPSERELRCRGD